MIQKPHIVSWRDGSPKPELPLEKGQQTLPCSFFAVEKSAAHLWGQHRTIVSVRFGGSFPPILRFEKFEIHKVFLRFSNLDLTKNLSPNLLAKLCVDALGNSQNVQNYLCLSCPESQSETTFRTQSFNLNFITFHQKTQGVFREN